MLKGISAKEFRKEKINILDHSAIILTSRNAVDNFFRLCTEMRVVVPESMKYFCISESTAFYLQKYVQYRKRKIFYGNQKVHRTDGCDQEEQDRKVSSALFRHPQRRDP
jgi:uroporphyrinogen-III synthase